MSGIVKSKKFVIDGASLTFAAGVKAGSPVVVFGMKMAGGVFDVATLEIPFPTLPDAVAYVDAASEDTARQKQSDLTGSIEFKSILSAFSPRQVTRQDLQDQLRRKR